jgi:DNA-binding transcriptional regulator YiaG
MSVAPFWTDDEVAKLHRVFGTTRRKVELEAHFPGRTWAGVVQKGRSLGLRRREYWTVPEEMLLIQIYEHTPKAEIMARLPRRQWTAIERKASELKVKRDLRKKHTKHAIVAELRRIRRQRGIQSDSLAAKFGSYGSAMANWESGRRTPTLQTLLAWAAALNLEIVLQTKGIVANTATALVQRPGESHLMARDAQRMRRAA